MHHYPAVLALFLLVLSAGVRGPSHARAADDGQAPVVEQVYQGELVSFPGPWGFLGKADIILVSDQELETIAADPDAQVNLALDVHAAQREPAADLRAAQQAGHRTLIIAFDHFFRQYRPGQDKPRRLTPDMPEYIALIAKISQFAQQYGLGLELSLLSPLEIGPAYEQGDRRVRPVDALPQGTARSADRHVQRPAVAATTVGQQQGADRRPGRGRARVRVSGAAPCGARRIASCRRSPSSRSPMPPSGCVGRQHDRRMAAADPRARQWPHGHRAAEPRAGRADVSHAGNGLLQHAGAALPARSSSTNTPTPA